MFEAITKKRKNRIINYIGWALLTVVCVVFIFIGYDFNQGFLGSTGAAAEVNGDAISLRSFSEMVERMEGQSQATDSESQRRLRENAINVLVNQELVFQKSKKIDLYVSDDEVFDTLVNIEGFQEDGRFSRTRYQQYLRQVRQSKEEFENYIRKFLMQRKILKLIGHVADPIPMFEELDDKLDKAKINVSYLAFNKFNSKTVSVPPQAEIDQFMIESEDKIKKYYEDNKTTTYTDKEQVKARHILVKFEEGKPDSEGEAKKKIENIKKEATLANFSELAKKHSEDPGSKTRGGDLGFFPRGRMVPPFEEVAFSIEKGKISEPVKSKFGYHLIVVDDKKAERQKTYEEVKKEIAANLVREGKFNALENDMRAALKAGDMEKIAQLANQNSLRWKDTGLYSITEEFVPGVGKIQPFIDGTADLSKDQPISPDLISYMNNRYILKLKEAKIDSESSKKKDSQMDFFAKMIAQQRANMVMQSWIDSLKQNASIKINNQLIR